MRSIDNLRDYVLTAPSVCSTTRAILVGYIDDIDREVAEVRDRDYRNGVEDGEMAAERDGWVRLPVDADGVPIHVGDVMEWVDIDGEVQVVCTVDAVGVECFFAWDNANGRFAQKCANAYRHHHAPTVEDVLREFTDEVWDRCCEGATASDSGIDELVAEYAAKLALRGDE